MTNYIRQKITSKYIHQEVLMKKSIDIMCDIETLGTDESATIFQIAAVAFDIKTGEHLAEFNQVADIALNEKPLNVSGSTLKWWLKTNKELFADLLHEGSLSSENTLKAFWNWLEVLEASYELRLWGNGILFDNNLIRHQLQAQGLRYPIKYWNDRDVRTIVHLASEKEGISEKELKQRYQDESLIKHDAYDDVRFQVALVHICHNLLTK